MLMARIPLNLSQNPSLSSIALGRSYGWHAMAITGMFLCQKLQEKIVSSSQAEHSMFRSSYFYGLWDER